MSEREELFFCPAALARAVVLSTSAVLNMTEIPVDTPARFFWGSFATALEREASSVHLRDRLSALIRQSPGVAERLESMSEITPEQRLSLCASLAAGLGLLAMVDSANGGKRPALAAIILGMPQVVTLHALGAMLAADAPIANTSRPVNVEEHQRAALRDLCAWAASKPVTASEIAASFVMTARFRDGKDLN